MVFLRNRNLLAGLRLEMGEDLTARLQHFGLFTGDKERQRLVFRVGDFDVCSRFFHDIAASLDRLTLAEALAAV